MSTNACPTCQEPLQRAKANDVALRSCPRCRGVWCSAGKLAELEGTSRDMAPVPDAEPVMDKGCPECPMPIAMEQRPYLDDHPLMVDVCPSCAGVWLDPGELRQLMKLRRKRRAEDREANAAILRAADQLVEARKHRVLKSKRIGVDLSCFITAGILGWLLTSNMAAAIVTAGFIGFLGDRYFTEYGWFRFLGPFPGFFGGFRLNKRR